MWFHNISDFFGGEVIFLAAVIQNLLHVLCRVRLSSVSPALNMLFIDVWGYCSNYFSLTESVHKHVLTMTHTSTCLLHYNQSVQLLLWLVVVSEYVSWIGRFSNRGKDTLASALLKECSYLDHLGMWSERISSVFTTHLGRIQTFTESFPQCLLWPLKHMSKLNETQQIEWVT